MDPKMLPARHFPLGEKLVWLLIRSSLQKHFDRVLFRMRYEPIAGQQALPIIICANHSSWWDGYAAAVVRRHLKLDGYLMMEEAQLRRYFFFSWIGCFSVNRSNPRSALQSLQYAARLLKERSRSMVWIFPQGEISPNDYRPLTFFSGASHLARLAYPLLIYPAAMRIEYLAEQRPDLFISLGEPLQIGAKEVQSVDFLKSLTRHLEVSVTTELDLLRSDVIAQNLSSFTRVMHGRSSTNRIFDTLLFRKQMHRQ